MQILIILTMLLKITECEHDKRIITTLKYSRYYVKPVIVNGAPAYKGQVPYLVSIKDPAIMLSAGRIIWQNLCGGSIISELRVLTAAHCFEGNHFYYAKHPGKLRVVAGNLKNNLVHSGSTESTEQAQWRKITKVIIHRHFGFPSNDISLVFVNKKWKFTTTVDYIVTATRQTDYAQSCYAAGFGRTGYSLLNSVSPVMLVAKIDVMTRWKCSLLWEMNMNSYICTDSVMSDVSMGDSGGPLACSGTLDPGERSGKDILVGVVSGKNFDKTTLFTRVSAYRDWIAKDSCARVTLNVYLLIITWFSLIYLLFYLQDHQQFGEVPGSTYASPKAMFSIRAHSIH